MPPSTIFLDEHFLHGQTGDGIILADSGVIGTRKVGSNIQNTMLSLSNYDKTSPNILLNPQFNTGTLSDWGTVGSPTIQSTDYPGLLYECLIDNLESIYQTVASSFQYKHPVFEFWHKGESLVLSLETRDGSNVYVDGVNAIIPQSDTWVNYSIGMRNYYPSTAISAKVTLSSVWDGVSVANCSLIASDYYSSVNIGDEYDADSTDVVRISGKKLMIGSGLPAINSSIFDVRGNSYFLGDLTVTGTITSGPIYGSIGTQKWVSNIIFTSGSQTLINFTSGNIQLVSGQIFGIDSGNSGTLSQTTFLYLDSDVSTTTLQTTTNYSLVIGANKIFIGTCYPGTTGYASFVSQSNNLPLINATDLITPFSITNGNLAINSVTASNITVSNLSSISANFGSITAGIVTLGSAGSYLNFGANPPVSSTGTLGLSGLFQDYTGLYCLTNTTLNASISSAGISAANGVWKVDSTGQTLVAGVSETDGVQIKWKNNSNTLLTSISTKEDVFTYFYIRNLQGTPTSIQMVSDGTINLSGTVSITGNLSAPNVWNLIKKTTTETRISNAVLTDDSTLTFSTFPATIYNVRGKIFFDTAATPDFQYRFQYTGVVSLIRGVTKYIIPGTTTLTATVETALPSTTTAVLGSGTTGGYIEYDFDFSVSAGGTFSFQWAQNTSNASNTSVLLGSYMEYIGYS